eukprot:GFUD01001342.1.p1 GENE.GFUD01001342.1~~GFUD01001342.1.p1  ORF type:complete len:390 (-),score=83.74 GFUD01001342.1:11-1138(-)
MLKFQRCGTGLVSTFSHEFLNIPRVGIHTTTTVNSRIKKVVRHKPMWHIKKLNKAEDEPITGENRGFVQELLADKYSGPLKAELAPWNRGSWEPWTRRCGVLGVKIGAQPLWLKDGRLIMTTLLHVVDNHVVKFTPRGEYDGSYIGEKDLRPCYTGPGRRKRANISGMMVVGSHSTDPQKYTKDYCGLFTESGLMPKRHLARFPVTENAVIQPGTALTASHFTVGQWVDVFGRTQERGFQGVMKRWGFKGMPDTHGVTKSHRRPGCIGSGNDKARVFPGQKMPGNVGGGYTWNCGLRVWRINHAESVLYVTGVSVQGKVGSVVQICDTRIPGHRWEALGHGPQRFPTTYGDEADLPEEEYHELIHQFSEPSISYS